MLKGLVGAAALVAAMAIGASVVSAQPGLRWQLAQLSGLAGLAAAPQCAVQTSAGEITLPARSARTLMDRAIAGDVAAVVTAPDGTTVRVRDLDPSSPARISCTVAPTELAQQDLQRNGLTARANRMRDAVLDRFGAIPDGGYAPGGVSTGHGAVSAHYQGLAVDFFFRPYEDAAQRARGWTVANWLAANAARLKIAVLIYDDQIWSARRAAEGWRQYSHPDGYTDPINRHLDHIHVDVLAGA